MTRKTELTLAEKVAILVKHGKAHGLSTTAYGIAHATSENTTNIQRIFNGENANPGLRTLTAITRHFGIGLGYLDCRTASGCQAYLAQLEAHKARDEVSDEKLLAEITQWSHGLSLEGLLVLKSLAEYLKRLGQ